jgi:glycosyltransferase involved in cell wall biosynthesis
MVSDRSPADGDDPRVSVILRTRNRPEMLRAALRDILGQTFDDVEIVLVNDGDDSAVVEDIITSTEGASAVVRLVDRTRQTHGRSLAANAGVSAARGSLLVVHDDDDAWKPEFLERTVAYLDAHPEEIAVSARTEMVIHRPAADGQDARTDRGLFNQGQTAITIADMLRANRITTISLLYRADVHGEVGSYDESLDAHEDWDFYLRVILRHPIGLLPLPALAEWHHRPGATGDAGNSVYALEDEHSASRLRVADGQLRAEIARSGPGAALHLAYEVQRLEDLLDTHRSERAAADDDIVARLDSLSRQVAEQSQLIRERTSLTSSTKRLRSLFARRDR